MWTGFFGLQNWIFIFFRYIFIYPAPGFHGIPVASYRVYVRFAWSVCILRNWTNGYIPSIFNYTSPLNQTLLKNCQLLSILKRIRTNQTTYSFARAPFPWCNGDMPLNTCMIGFRYHPAVKKWTVFKSGSQTGELYAISFNYTFWLNNLAAGTDLHEEKKLTQNSFYESEIHVIRCDHCDRVEWLQKEWA